MKKLLAAIIVLCMLCCTLTSCHKTRFVVKGLTDEYGNTYDAVGYRNERGTDCYLGHIDYYVSSDINNFKIVIPESLRDSSNGKDYPVVALQGANRANGPVPGIIIHIDLQNEQVINTPLIIEVITDLDDICAYDGDLILSDANGNIISDVDFLFVKPGTNHEHTYKMEYWGSHHHREYTCGCINVPAYLEHYGFDGDGLCDVCGYEHHHTKEEYRNEEGHGWEYTCGCKTPDNFAKHSDDNDDEVCDECGYTMIDRSDE